MHVGWERDARYHVLKNKQKMYLTFIYKKHITATKQLDVKVPLYLS